MTAHRFNPTTARAAVKKARAGLTPEQRSESARNAAAARWRKAKGEDWTPPAEDVSLEPFYDEVDRKFPGLSPAARTVEAERLRSNYARGERL